MEAVVCIVLAARDRAVAVGVHRVEPTRVDVAFRSKELLPRHSAVVVDVGVIERRQLGGSGSDSASECINACRASANASAQHARIAGPRARTHTRSLRCELVCNPIQVPQRAS